MCDGLIHNLDGSLISDSQLNPWHYLVTALALVGFRGPLQMLGLDDIDGEINRVLMMTLYGAMFAIAIYVLLKRKRIATKIPRVNRWLLAFLGFAVLSSLWSSMTGISINRAIQLLCMVGLALSFLRYFTTSDLIKLLQISCAIAFVYTLVFIFAFPEQSIAVDSLERLRGPFESPNNLGQFAVLSICVWFPALRFGAAAPKRIIALFVVTTGISFVFLADSATSITLIIVIILLNLVRGFVFSPSASFMRAGKILIFYLFMGALLIGSVYGNEILDYITAQWLGALGRNTELTGRLPLWTVLFADLVSNNRLLVGYGYGGYWQAESGPAYDLLYGTWTPNQAHNGYLDIMLQTGVIGLLLFVPYLFICAKDAVKYLRYNQAEGMILMNIVVTTIIQNLSESSFTRNFSALWIIFLAVSMGLRSEVLRYETNEQTVQTI